MGIAQDLQKTTLELRKQRVVYAPGFQTVWGFAQASAKERGLKGGDANVNDEDALRAIQKGIKMNKDVLDILPTDGVAQQELAALEALLPQMATEDEVRAAAAQYVATNELDAKKGMGQVMAHLSATFGTSLDKSMASRIAREALVAA
jgi:uncharacterized protein YqeY